MAVVLVSLVSYSSLVVVREWLELRPAAAGEIDAGGSVYVR